MKITKRQLKRIVQEEIEKMIKESDPTQWEAGRGPVASRFQEPPPPAPEKNPAAYTTGENPIEELQKKYDRCEDIKKALMQPPYNKSEEDAAQAMDYFYRERGHFCW